MVASSSTAICGVVRGTPCTSVQQHLSGIEIKCRAAETALIHSLIGTTATEDVALMYVAVHQCRYYKLAYILSHAIEVHSCRIRS